jgi:hypothetical protein
MHHVNDLIGKVYQNEQIAQPMRHSGLVHNPEFLKAVLTSLTKMGLLSSPDRELYQIWASGLSEFSESQIKHGLFKAQDFRGFFNLPAFRELCRVKPEDLGLPDVKKAYVEACMAPTPKVKHKWSHPAVYHAGKQTGWFELSSLPEEQMFARFKSFYASYCDRVMAGEKLDAPMMEALPERVTVILTPEENQDRMDKLRRTLDI